MCRGVGLDGRGKAQWLGVQEGKSAIFVGVGGCGIAFIFRPGGLNPTICPIKIVKNISIKRRMTGFGLKPPGDGGSANMAPTVAEVAANVDGGHLLLYLLLFARQKVQM